MNCEYKFETIKLTGFLNLRPARDYQDIIAKHAEDGWRFVQIFAPDTSGYGKA